MQRVTGLLFLLLLCCVTSMAEEASDSVGILKVGVVAPLSGNLGFIGESIRNMIALADSDFDSTDRIEFIFEDDVFDPKKTVSAVKKLLASDKVGGFILFGSGTSLAAGAILEQLKVPSIAIAMSDSTVKGKKFIFRHYVPVEAQARAIAKEIARRRYDSIAIVSTEQEATLQFKNLIHTYSSVPVSVDEILTPGDTGLASLALRIKASNPSAVFFNLLPPELSILPLELRKIHYSGEFFGSSQLQNESAVRAAQGALSNTWFVGPDDSNAKKLNQRYSDHFKLKPVPEGLNAYDSAKLFVLCAKAVDLPACFINSERLTGVFGPYQIGPHNTFKIPVAVKLIRNNEFLAID